MDDPFMRPDDVRYAQILTDAAISVLRIMATDRFSVSAMARWMKVEPPAVLGQYSRSRVVELVCICFTERWLSWSSTPDDEPTDAPFLLRLPGTAAEVHGVRVLAALRELARGEFMRGNPLPDGHLSRLDAYELDVVRRRLDEVIGRRPTDDEAHTTMALVDGLRAALVRPESVIEHGEAERLLTTYVLSLTTDPDADRTAA